MTLLYVRVQLHGKTLSVLSSCRRQCNSGSGLFVVIVELKDLLNERMTYL